MKKFNTNTTSVTQSSDAQVKAREELWDYFIADSMPDAEKERNLGLYIRSQNLARILTISSIYQKIKNLPGSIIDYGTWREQNFGQKEALNLPSRRVSINNYYRNFVGCNIK